MARRMQQKPNNGRIVCLAKPAVACFVAALLVFVAILSASHSLHQLLHHDGDAQQHICLACLFANGQVSAAELAPLTPAIVPECFALPALAMEQFLAHPDHCLPPGRAPPCA
jgi:hypothetical protein